MKVLKKFYQDNTLITFEDLCEIFPYDMDYIANNLNSGTIPNPSLYEDGIPLYRIKDIIGWFKRRKSEARAYEQEKEAEAYLEIS